MKIKQIFEEFKTGVKKGDEYYEIFYTTAGKPLKPAEMETLQGKAQNNQIRFMVDYEKDMAYFWDGGLLHVYAAGAIGMPYSEPNFDKRKCHIWGEGNIENGVFSYVDSFNPISDFDISMNSMSVLRYIKRFEKCGNPKSADMIVGLKKELDKYIRRANAIINKEGLKIK